jgi:hypothetical protein
MAFSASLGEERYVARRLLKWRVISFWVDSLAICFEFKAKSGSAPKKSLRQIDRESIIEEKIEEKSSWTKTSFKNKFPMRRALLEQR